MGLGLKNELNMVRTSSKSRIVKLCHRDLIDESSRLGNKPASSSTPATAKSATKTPLLRHPRRPPRDQLAPHQDSRPPLRNPAEKPPNPRCNGTPKQSDRDTPDEPNNQAGLRKSPPTRSRPLMTQNIDNQIIPDSIQTQLHRPQDTIS